MNYADIKQYDVANGPGVRVSIFVSGCTHKCPGCFNQVAWDFDYGTPFTDETIDMIIESLDKPYIAGFTILGGEPLEPSNQQGLLPLVKKIKESLPNKTIWCYTGFDFEKDVLEKMFKEFPETPALFSYLDIVVDGTFVEELKSLSLRFKGSSNQRIIKVQESLNTGSLVLWNPETSN